MINIKKSALAILFLSLSLTVGAQTKTRSPQPKKTNAAPVDPVPEATPPVKSPGKKNERPDASPNAGGNTSQTPKSNVSSEKNVVQPVYFYEFSQPAFLVSQINIEFDENGKGRISFLKKNYDELISDPIQVSTAALAKIKNALDALKFLDSDENYQYEKDFSHLGNIKIKVKTAGREREAKFNFTSNPKAKELADEFRKLGQQFVWIFDINVARENQPLEAPRLLDSLDSLVRRNEVSDAIQLIPFLKELSDDERIPLISRNHAAKLIKQIEKTAEKAQ